MMRDDLSMDESLLARKVNEAADHAREERRQEKAGDVVFYVLIAVTLFIIVAGFVGVSGYHPDQGRAPSSFVR